MTTKRVLIIEDEKPIRDAFGIVLKDAGYNVEMAENGKIGLKKLKLFKPDVIILDVLMPIMNGVTFLKQAKFPINSPKTKIVVLSNLSDPLNQEIAKRGGVYQTILKAELTPAKLLKLIQSSLL